MPTRLTTDEAAHRLGVKRETVYAYVSRGVLTSRRSKDGRTSTFDTAEVERLARRGRPRRTTHGPVIDVTVHSALTRLDRGRLTFRGLDAVHLSGTVAFEQVAELLWSGSLTAFRAWPGPASVQIAIPPGQVIDRLRAAAALVALGAPVETRRPDGEAMTAAARLTVAAMTSAIGEPRHERTPRLHLGGDAPRSLRDTTAARVAVRLSPTRPGPELVAALNAALVLLADHELAVSTLAARVAASARTDGFGVVGAGMGPLSGALHGTASRFARVLIDEADRVGATAAVQRYTDEGNLVGFGHPLYPLGDPRAVALLTRVRALPVPARRLAVVDDLVAAAAVAVETAPNADFALAALGHVAGMPTDAGEAIFAVARTAGWIAHALEELAERPLRYRTRAVARGPNGL